MPRTALTALLLLLGASPLLAIDPHVDPSIVEAGCPACHLGHGVSRSPMLAAPQRQVCMECHDSQAKVGRLVAERVLAATANPQLLSQVFSEPFVHPVNEQAFSRYEPGMVTCTSCHSPHRDNRRPDLAADNPSGQRKLSPRDPSRFEFELCQSCHGNEGYTTQSPTDLSRLTNPNNRSYHPVQAPSTGQSPSVLPNLQGREINCTDCHGNSKPDGPRGPHGSSVSYILRYAYTTVDGSQESERVYALCYECHDRELVLELPLHQDHVVDKRASCFSCHNPHGSVDNRALIRFGDNTIVGGLAPSISTGRLAFVSVGPGSGSCFLTCHGVDHGPKSYGASPELGPLPSSPDLGALESRLTAPLSAPALAPPPPEAAPARPEPPPHR
jgi:predicted CXXCH cytochrome family protein